MKRILLVDDNKMDRRVIMHLLIRNFVDQIFIEEAPDGLVALDMLSKTSYDLIITDLVMPRIEGLELINKIKAKDPSIPIIAISGSNPYYLVMADKLGINCSFTKPLNVIRFISAVGSIFGFHEKMKIA